MREESEDRDHYITEVLNERERLMRDWWATEANRQDDILLCQMLLLLKDVHHASDQ